MADQRSHEHLPGPGIADGGTVWTPPGATRRDALRLIGGGATLAALMTSRLQGGALAEDASPVADDDSKVGLYVVMRTRTVKADMSIDALTAALTEDLVPLIREIPGFVEYYVVQNFETRERTGVSIFADKEGADESTRIAGEYIASQGLSDFYESADPVVHEGTIVTFAA